MVRNLSKKLVFGTWPLSGDFSLVKKSEAKKLILFAIKNGFREFDTAPNYGFGRSEKILGELEENIKKKIRINTKIGNSHSKDKSFNLKKLENSIKNSLKILGVKKINNLFLHNPKNIKNIDKIIVFLKKLKKKKLINNFGLSIAKDHKYKIEFLKKFQIIQLDHNLIYFKNKFDDKFKNKYIYARSPLASGLLVNNIDEKKFKKSDPRSFWFKDDRKKTIKSQIYLIKKRYKKKIFSLAIEYVLKDRFCNKVIFGFRSISQLKNFLETKKKILKEGHWKTFSHEVLTKKNFFQKGF